MTRTTEDREALSAFVHSLIDQQRAVPIVTANANASGYWFGGGNMIQDADGSLLVCGRYRNAGDSRTGLAAGERGLELAIFRSADLGETWSKSVSFIKADLHVEDQSVLSIEGCALRRDESGYELFVSTEKGGRPYPAGLESYHKPGTGVWSIERLRATSLDGLATAAIEPTLSSDEPETLHVKDPFLFDGANGETVLGFCTHPFSWASSNTGWAVRPAGAPGFNSPIWNGVPRGACWDVAITRTTAVLSIPQAGALAGISGQLVFYCGGECLRNLDEHAAAAKRPRGYSCEELGGWGLCQNHDLSTFERMSLESPAFVSPNATGCSRYVSVLQTDDAIYATWQQAQADGSQPLVMVRLPMSELT